MSGLTAPAEDAPHWSQLGAAYGPATAIPGLLRQLASPMAESRDSAISKLWGALCHQGTVYEASAAAVPYLYRAAVEPSRSDAERDQLLALVAHIGLGEDTTWRGYTSWAVVQDCADSVAAVLPDLAAQALGGVSGTRRWAIVLAAFFPDVWWSTGVDVDLLLSSVDPVHAEVVRAAVGDAESGSTVLVTLVGQDLDLAELREDVLPGVPEERHARLAVLELATLQRF